jgi:uncharacterized membrane protein
MFNQIKHPISFFLLIAYFIITATMITPHIWSAPLMLMLIVIGIGLRWICHREGAGSFRRIKAARHE